MATDKVKQCLEVSSEMIREQNERHLSDEEEDRFLSKLDAIWLGMSISEQDEAALIQSQEAVGHELPIQQCRFIIGTRARLATRLGRGLKPEDLEIVDLDWNWIDGELGFSLKISGLEEIGNWAKQCGAVRSLTPRFRIDADWKVV